MEDKIWGLYKVGKYNKVRVIEGFCFLWKDKFKKKINLIK